MLVEDRLMFCKLTIARKLSNLCYLATKLLSKSLSQESFQLKILLIEVCSTASVLLVQYQRHWEVVQSWQCTISTQHLERSGEILPPKPPQENKIASEDNFGTKIPLIQSHYYFLILRNYGSSQSCRGTLGNIKILWLVRIL